MIYFIQCNGDHGPIKIGHTNRSASARLRSMESANPYPLRLLGSMPGSKKREALIQHRFRKSRIKGEWYKPTPDLLQIAYWSDTYSEPANKTILGRFRAWLQIRKIPKIQDDEVGLTRISRAMGIPTHRLRYAIKTGKLEANNVRGQYFVTPAAVERAIAAKRLRRK